jgi:hypothetical protein
MPVGHVVHNRNCVHRMIVDRAECTKILCSDAIVLWRACVIGINQHGIVWVSALLFVTSVGTLALYHCA